MRPVYLYSLLIVVSLPALAFSQTVSGPSDAAQQYLESILPTQDQVDLFLGRGPDHLDTGGYDPNGGFHYHPQLGWVHRNAVRPHGIDGSLVFYHYDQNGSRQRIQYPDLPSRIHTFGNSFTLCSQVNDGETWQERLAAHLEEPIENYGVGGYSVYQAYLRMKIVEEDHPAPWVILNIYDDDHYRNLDAWRSIRGRNRGPAGFTLPSLQVDVENDRVTERPNPCPTAEDVYRLQDLDWVLSEFGDDPVLDYAITKEAGVTPDAVERIAAKFGLTSYYRRNDEKPAGNLEEELDRLYRKAALFATRKVLEMTEQYLDQRDKKLLVVLSYGSRRLGPYLAGEQLPGQEGQEFLDFLATRDYPVVDLRTHHTAEFNQFRESADAYLKRYYNGHYNPAGNLFTAMTIKDAVVRWLDPKPKTYQEVE